MRKSLAFLAALTVGAAACQPGPAATGSVQPPSEKPAARQVLRVSTDGLPPSPSPESAVQIPIFWHQFDPLVTFDKNLNLVPQAAEKWESLPSGAGWRFTLRKDMTFSNGDKMTAADVEFTVKNIVDNRLITRGQFPTVTGAKMVDDYTVDILTQRLDISVVYSANYLFVLPKKYYEQVGKDTFASKPIGTGPYELAEYQTERLHVYKLRSTPHPFRKPKLSEVRWQNVPDSSASTTGLRTGDLDLLIGAFTPDQADKMKSDGMQIVVAVSTNAMLSIDKNATERHKSPLLDKRVRLALNYAIDKESIGKTVYKGFSKPIGQLSIPGALMYDESLKPIPYDPAQAKRLLTEAGYPNGFKLVEGIDYATTYSGAQPMLLAVQDYWKQVGVETSVNQVEIGAYLDKLFGRGGRTRPEVVINSSGDANGMAALPRTFFLCSIPPEAQIICVPEFDRNLNLAYAELDAEKRRGYMQAANRAFVAEMPAIFLLVNPIFRFANPKVRDVIIDNATFYNLDSVFMVE